MPLLAFLAAFFATAGVQSLRAQSNDTGTPATPSTPASGPVEINSPPLQLKTHVAPPSNAPTATAPAAVEGSTNAATASPELNIPELKGATNQPPVNQEGPAGPGEMSNLLSNPAVQDITNESTNTPIEGSSAALPTSPAVQEITNPPGFWDSLWQRGSPFHAGLTVGETYDDNILITPQKTGSFLTHITPNLDYQRGDQTAPHMNYLNVYFAPTVVLYQDHSQYDRTDYNADLYYQYTWTRLEVGVEQQFQHLTDASLDVGTLVDRDIYTTKFNASYIYDDNLTFFGTATQALNYYPETTINEWDIDTFALYQIAPKLLIGAGPRFSFVDITGATNQTHQDLLFRLKYLPDTKISIGLDGGVEYLHYQDNTPSRITPIFDANVTYSPRDGTSVFVSGYRATLNSYDIQSDTIGYTTFQVGGSQLFYQKFKLTGSFGYTKSDYNLSSGRDNSNPTPNNTQNNKRNDDYYFAKGVLEWNPNTWLRVQASYQWSENQSSFSENTFSDNQVDIQTSINF